MVSIRLQGAEKLATALKGMSLKQERAAMVKVLKVAAVPFRSRMEAHAPVEPGKPDLRDHIVISTTNTLDNGDRRDDSVHLVAVGPSKPFFYGKFLEFGTVKMSARPFVRPAFDEGQAEAFRLTQEGIWALLRSLAPQSPTSGLL